MAGEVGYSLYGFLCHNPKLSTSRSKGPAGSRSRWSEERIEDAPAEPGEASNPPLASGKFVSAGGSGSVIGNAIFSISSSFNVV